MLLKGGILVYRRALQQVSMFRLSGPIVKLAECLVIDEVMERIRLSVGLLSLASWGVATPDGVRLVVRVARARASDVASKVSAGGPPALEEEVVIVWTNLRNAYGRRFRSTGTKSAVKRAPPAWCPCFPIFGSRPRQGLAASWALRLGR